MPKLIWDPHGLCQEITQVCASVAVTDDAELAHIHILPTHSQYSVLCSSRLTVFVDTEPVQYQAADIYEAQRRARPNHVWAVSAQSSTVGWPSATVDFFSNMLFVSRLNPDVKPVTLAPKPWLAAALWGGWMRNRAIMLRELRRRELDGRCLITHLQRANTQDEIYYQDSTLYQQYQTPEIAALDLEIFNSRAYDQGFYTMHQICPEQVWAFVSQLIPYRIYDSALVSIVSETFNNDAPDTFYISEKISRAILVAHPFWVMGCQGFLARLRDLGFRTYSSWWDESYDDIADEDQRALAVIESFAEFAHRGAEQQQQISQQARSNALHNRDRMRDMGWIYHDLVQLLGVGPVTMPTVHK